MMFSGRISPAFAGTMIVGWLAAGLGGVAPAHASVVIDTTRVIYAAPAREATVKLTNEGQGPALTQIWMDAGDMKAAPAGIAVPFLVTPPVARIDPGRAQTLRVFHTGDPLPTDRESVFYLNVLEVPPKPKSDSGQSNQNLLQLAFRSRIKFFFRPANLPGTAAEAPEKIRWRLLRDAPDRPVLEATNPTAYHVSIASLRVTRDADSVGSVSSSDEGGMVSPGGTHRFALKGELPAGSTALTVLYNTINDYGGSIKGTASVPSP